MKLKYYLRGLGTGIIFTGIVLMIIYSYRTTETKIKERARELGMVEASETAAAEQESGGEKSSTEPESSKEESGTEPESSREESSTEPESSKEESSTEPESSSGEESSTEEDTTQASAEVTITISAGMYSESVSMALHNSGLIDNAALFNQYLTGNGYADRIKTGTFVLHMGMSYSEIADIITG